MVVLFCERKCSHFRHPVFTPHCAVMSWCELFFQLDKGPFVGLHGLATLMFVSCEKMINWAINSGMQSARCWYAKYYTCILIVLNSGMPGARRVGYNNEVNSAYAVAMVPS